MNSQAIPAEAVEAAAKAYRDYPRWEDLHEDGREWRREYVRAALEAAAPHMLADEAKLAAVIVALDPFERVTKWMATDDEAGRYALEAVQKIRAILDGAK